MYKRLIERLAMMLAASKHRIAFILILIFNCLSKQLLILSLKRDAKLPLFRSLKEYSLKVVKCEGSIELLRLCQNFSLTPTLARVDKTRQKKWKLPSLRLQTDILAEELENKLSYLSDLKAQVKEIKHEIEEKCSTLKYMCVIKVIAELCKRQYDQMMSKHTENLSRLPSKELDVDQHIYNILSHDLSFFQKLIIYQGLKFSLPQKLPARDVKASFVKMYWKVESHLCGKNKELTSPTLRSIALNYNERKPSAPPKALLCALNHLKNKDDIVVSKPDKGDGVIIMDKSDYIRLLNEASVNNETKFILYSTERPKIRGRKPKHYHPLLQRNSI